MGHKAGKIALGLGILTGAITGLLFAPDEGKNIRKKIAKGDTKALLGDLEDMANEMKDMAVDFVKSPGVQDLFEGAKDKVASVANMKREELDSMLRKANRKGRMFQCCVCGYSLHADLNASRNIACLAKGRISRLVVNQPNVACDELKASLREELRASIVTSLASQMRGS